MSEKIARSARGQPAGRGGGRWWQDEAWLALAGPALIFLGHTLYGAMLPATALAVTVATALLLGVIMMRKRLRNELSRLDGLRLPAVLFAAVIVVGLMSLTPWIPGGAHPVWSYLGLSPGAATIDKSQTLLEIVKLLG
ncbi:MAG: O-antigen ligase family protein, partial [Phenylobacterium sp.]